MTPEPVVYVVDDDEQARESLATLLSESGFRVQAYSCGPCFLDEFKPPARGCLLLDLRMPKMDGIQVQERLLDRGRLLPTIMLTAYGDIPSTVRAMKLGAIDVVEKPYSPSLLIDRVRAACAIGREGTERSPEGIELRAAVRRLSRRERQVCRFLIQGLTPKEIAFELKISHRTAQLHRERILEKCGLRSVVELSRWAEVIGPDLAEP